MVDNPLGQAPQTNQPAAPIMPVAPAAANQTSMRGMVATPQTVPQMLTNVGQALASHAPPSARAMTVAQAPPPRSSGFAEALMQPLTALIASHAIGNIANAAPSAGAGTVAPAAAPASGVGNVPRNALADGGTLSLANTPGSVQVGVNGGAPIYRTPQTPGFAAGNQQGVFPESHPGDLAIAAPGAHSEDAFVKAVTGMPWSRAMQLVQALHPPNAQEQAMRLALQSAPSAAAAAKMIHMWSAPQSYLYGGMQDPFAAPQPQE